MTCRTCLYLDVKPDAGGRRRPRKGNVYPCKAPLPVRIPLLPDSVTGHYGYVSIETAFERKRHMEPDDGADCPTWTADV